MIPNKIVSPNSDLERRGESAALPPGGTRDHVQCSAPAASRAWKGGRTGESSDIDPHKTPLLTPRPFLSTGHSLSGQFP